MAFPTVQSTNTSSETSNVGTHNVDLPATVAADDFIIIIASVNQSPVITPPTGFTTEFEVSNGTTTTLVGFKKKAAGTEGGTTVTFATDSNQQSAHVSYAGDGWSEDITDIESSTGATGNDDSPDPDSVTASWGSDDNLFIAMGGVQRGDRAFSVYPYTDNQLTINTSAATAGAGVAAASEEIASASSDPGTFTISTGNLWVAGTLVIKPAGGAPGDPVVTGPTTATEGTNSNITGTDLDTLASSGDVALITTVASFRKTQVYGTVLATSIADVEWETGQDEARDAGGTTPVSGVPLVSTINATGITAYQNQIEVDDGVATPFTFNIAVSPESGLQVAQTMIAEANTTAGESLFGTDVLTVENDHQVNIPTVEDSVTLNLAFTGVITVDAVEMAAAGNSITFDSIYLSPGQEEWQKVVTTLTVEADVTPPILESAVINAAGTQITFLSDENINIGVGGSAGFTFFSTGAAVTATFLSGGGTPSLVYTLSRVVAKYEVITYDYVQPGDGIEDDFGNDLVSFEDDIVTNGSTINSPPTDINLAGTTVEVDAGANAGVGTLTSVDLDTGDTHTYTLVAGTGDTNNASYNILGDLLRCTDPAVLGIGSYSVRIETDDGNGGTFEKAFSVSVVAASEIVGGGLIIGIGIRI